MSAISQCPGIGNEGRRCAKDEGHEGGCQAVWQADYWLVVARRLGQLIEGGNEWLAYGAAEGERFREQLERARLDLDNAYAYRVRAEAAEKECARLREADVFDGRTAEEWAKFYRYRYDDLVALVSRAEAAEAALATERATSNDTQTRQGARIRELIEQLAAARTVADQHLAAHDLLSEQLAAAKTSAEVHESNYDHMVKENNQLAAAQRGHVVENAGAYLRVNGYEVADCVDCTEASLAVRRLRAALGSPPPVKGHVVEVKKEARLRPNINEGCSPVEETLATLFVAGARITAGESREIDLLARKLRAALNVPAAKVAGLSGRRNGLQGQTDLPGSIPGRPASAQASEPAETCGATTTGDGRFPCIKAARHKGRHIDVHGGSWRSEIPAAVLAEMGLKQPAPARGYLLQLDNYFSGRHDQASKTREFLEPFATREEAEQDRAGGVERWRRARIVRADAPKCWVVREGKVRGEGLYFSWSHHAVGGWFVSTRESRWGFPAYAEAKKAAGSTGRVVAVYAKGQER